jgi:hypothetical protein
MFVRILAVLLVAGVLLAAGVYVYQVGLAQGYAQGAAVAGGETPQLEPGFRGYPGFGPGTGHGPWGFRFGFFLFFPLLACFFGLLFLFGIGGLFRARSSVLLQIRAATGTATRPPKGRTPEEPGPEPQPPADNA